MNQISKIRLKSVGLYKLPCFVMVEFAEAGLRAVGLLAGVKLKMIDGFKIDFN